MAISGRWEKAAALAPAQPGLFLNGKDESAVIGKGTANQLNEHGAAGPVISGPAAEAVFAQIGAGPHKGGLVPGSDHFGGFFFAGSADINEHFRQGSVFFLFLRGEDMDRLAADDAGDSVGSYLHHPSCGNGGQDATHGAETEHTGILNIGDDKTPHRPYGRTGALYELWGEDLFCER